MVQADYKSPTQLHIELGIRDPDDIDVEAIAFYCGATITYESLHGSAARIIGYKDRAIIAVDPRAPIGRRRFSAAHELGHWMRDRGKASFACSDAQLAREWKDNNPERVANEYASELLLPVGMFSPRAKAKPLIFDTVRELADGFRTSLTATAIRLVTYGSFPGMLLCVTQGRRRWFHPGTDVPRSLWPIDSPGRNTVAFDLVNGFQKEAAADVRASAWFEHADADRYVVHEHAVRINTGDVLSLLWWKDERQIIDLNDEEERRAARRSDWREDD